jgi:large subunit ribosomal protein L24
VIEKAAPIQISNVMLVCPVCNRPTRVGYLIKERKDEDDLKVRVCKRDDCRQEIDR